jgi:hypothetical protein
METFVAGAQCQDILLMTSDRGAHARKVMESYQTWFGEGPELSVLRMLGLFDRPADEKVLEALLKPPVISGLSFALSFDSFLRERTLGFTGGNGRRGAWSHPGRSAFHSHAGGSISDGHARICGTRGVKLLRTR